MTKLSNSLNVEPEYKWKKEPKYEFDNFDEWHEAMKHLEDYHDCEKCHGKIVGISIDILGNKLCSYCGVIVRYPRLTKEAFEKHLKELMGK